VRLGKYTSDTQEEVERRVLDAIDTAHALSIL